MEPVEPVEEPHRSSPFDKPPAPADDPFSKPPVPADDPFSKPPLPADA